MHCHVSLNGRNRRSWDERSIDFVHEPEIRNGLADELKIEFETNMGKDACI